MIKAVIDLGTNTFHLMIASKQDDQLQVHRKLQVPVKLGEDGITQGIIQPKAYQRAINALAEFNKILTEYKVNETLVFGTSAIRGAQNGQQFIDEVQKRFHLKIEAIEGDREAELIFEGVKHSFTLPHTPCLVMDIGGGSVEFIIGQQDKILWKKSYSIGAARLLAKFNHSEPIKDKEIVAVNDYVAQIIQDCMVVCNAYKVNCLIGSAGSFETLRDVLLHDLNAQLHPLSNNACKINKSEFDLFYHLMITSNQEQRAALKGMIDFRVDMMVVSAILMKLIVETTEVSEIIVSDFALKEGMFFSKSN